MPTTAGRPAHKWSSEDLQAAGLDPRFRSERFGEPGKQLHAVFGGQGEPLVLLPGWPQTWYAWRRTLNALASEYTVIAVDPRGFGGSDAAPGDYDVGTIADELVNFIQSEFGYRKFNLVGHDVGAWIAHSIAARHAESVAAVVLCEAIIPGLVDGPPMFLPAPFIERAWHFAFNRVQSLNEILVQGKETEFLRFQFENKAHLPDAISDDDLEIYARAYRSADHLRASFDYYRALDRNIQLTAESKANPFPMPVLAVGGEYGMGAGQEQSLKPYTNDLTGRVVPGVGHYPAEEDPHAMVSVLLDFFSQT